MRKIVQIAAGQATLFALCDDGTVFHTDAGAWHPVVAIPQGSPPGETRAELIARLAPDYKECAREDAEIHEQGNVVLRKCLVLEADAADWELAWCEGDDPTWRYVWLCKTEDKPDARTP